MQWNIENIPDIFLQYSVLCGSRIKFRNNQFKFSLKLFKIRLDIKLKSWSNKYFLWLNWLQDLKKILPATIFQCLNLLLENNFFTLVDNLIFNFHIQFSYRKLNQKRLFLKKSKFRQVKRSLLKIKISI